MYETETVCAACLKENIKKPSCVNDLDNDGISILEKLKYCIYPDLLNVDKFLKICHSCMLTLNSSYNFKKSVLKSLQTLNCLRENIIFKEDPEMPLEEKLLVSSSEETVTLNLNHENFMKNENKEDIHDIIEQMRSEALMHKSKSDEIIDGELNWNQSCLSFGTERKLQQHVAEIHKTNFSCMFCGNVFKTSFHLKEHITIHTGEKNYNCAHCDKAFPRLSSLRRHMKSHNAPLGQKTKKTPFLCPICGKSFPFSNGASRHMRIHFGVKAHECQVCNKKFIQSTHLHVHMRTHSGEKPYVCETCGESFTLRVGLHKHFKTIHKNENQDDCKIAKNNEFSLDNEVVYLNQFSI